MSQHGDKDYVRDRDAVLAPRAPCSLTQEKLLFARLSSRPQGYHPRSQGVGPAHRQSHKAAIGVRTAAVTKGERAQGRQDAGLPGPGAGLHGCAGPLCAHGTGAQRVGQSAGNRCAQRAGGVRTRSTGGWAPGVWVAGRQQEPVRATGGLRTV